MTPEPGQYVRVLFHNNTVVEGWVQSWSDERSVLLSDSRESLIIIQQTLRDVLTIVIEIRRKPKEELTARQQEIRNEIRERVKVAINPPPLASTEVSLEEQSDISEKTKPLPEVPESKSSIQNLVDLRKEALRLEKEEFSLNIRSHEMSGVGSVGTYALPNFSKKSRSFQHPSEENKGEDVRHYPSLSEMFGGEDEDNR